MKMTLLAALLLSLIVPAHADDKPEAAKGNPEVQAEKKAFKEEMKADRQAFKEKQKEKRSAKREKIKEMRAKARAERKAKKAAAEGSAAETAPVPESK